LSRQQSKDNSTIIRGYNSAVSLTKDDPGGCWSWSFRSLHAELRNLHPPPQGATTIGRDLLVFAW